jgi:hypothetical protein
MIRSSLGAALATAVAAATLLVLIPAPAPGCAAAPRHGEYVSTADETALIVWDEKTKTEHFVRRANFTSSAYDFGFLVPTPTRPHLDLADDTVFADLSALTAPAIEYRTVVQEVDDEFAFGCSAPMAASKAELAENMPMSEAKSAARGGVEAVEQKKLGDYDVAVLRFRRGTADTPESGAAELSKWLTDHGYESTAAIKTWLERYVKDEWCVTAFKIGAKQTDDPHGVKAEASPHTRHSVRAKPVRMSFKADRPFYPYREPTVELPANAVPASRLLRVFVAAPARYAGTLGDGSKPWPGQTVWAGSVESARWDGLFQKAKLTDPLKEDGVSLTVPKSGDGWWLTEFEDRSSPRPGTDEVYFAPSADASPVARPPVIVTSTKKVARTPWWHLVVYFGVPAALVLGGLGAWRLSRRA